MPAGPRRLPVPERRNGERDKVREAICTASTESAVNQVISKRTVKNSRCAGTTRCPPPAPGPHPRPQRPARRRLPPLVPRPQPDTGADVAVEQEVTTNPIPGGLGAYQGRCRAGELEADRQDDRRGERPEPRHPPPVGATRLSLVPGGPPPLWPRSGGSRR